MRNIDCRQRVVRLHLKQRARPHAGERRLSFQRRQGALETHDIEPRGERAGSAAVGPIGRQVSQKIDSNYRLSFPVRAMIYCRGGESARKRAG